MSKRFKITLIVLIAVVLWILCTIAIAEHISHWIVAPLVLLAMLLLGLVSLVLVVGGLFRRRKKLVTNSLIIIACIVSSVVVAKMVNGFLYEKSIEAGNLLVEAIEQYKVENGEYPDSLGLLVPEYIDTVPLARIGPFSRIPYIYVANDSTYSVSFPQGFIVLATNDSRRGEWVID